MFRKRLTDEELIYMYKMHEILGNPPITNVVRQVTQVLPHVYLGGTQNAESMQTLKTYDINYVLNCGASARQRESPYAGLPEQINYEQFLAVDEDNYNIGQHFNEAFSFLDKAKRKGGKVLVHCAMGINRSGVVCAAYVMKERGMKLLETLRMLKTKREVFLTNPGFRYHLFQFAKDRGLLEPLKDIKADLQSKLVDGKLELPDYKIGLLDEELEPRMTNLTTTYGIDDLARTYTVHGNRTPWRPSPEAEMARFRHARAPPGGYMEEEAKPLVIYRSIRPMEHEMYNEMYNKAGASSSPIFDLSLIPGLANSRASRSPLVEGRDTMPPHRYGPSYRNPPPAEPYFGRPRPIGLLSPRTYLY